MKKFIFIILSLLLIISVISSGCAKKTVPVAETEPKEILLGAINSVTGIEAMVGNEHRWAYQQAVNDINANGGVYVRRPTR